MEGFSSAVLADYGSTLPPDGHRRLARIQAGANKMGLLIDDLLAFSRMSRQELHMQPINTTALVHEVIDTLALSYPGRESSIFVGDLVDCRGDLSLLRQVWMNLISNALKYTSKTPEPRVYIRSHETDGELVFSVRDNGAGFDMAYAHKLFGVFHRLHSESEFEGTGVGLAIVKRVVERHKGRVGAEGAENQGAVFFFMLRKDRE